MTEKHALVIDDNEKNIRILSKLLEDQSVSSTGVDNSTLLDSVLDTLERVDVVFLDLEMPSLDGFQILDKLKADPYFQSVPVVAYTVHVSEIMVAHEHGFDGFIAKPLDSERFPDQLHRIFNGQGVWETK